MILSLVAEGRTVVLSSHLLDEVERTCDAVAIVDRGNVVRQGPISELLAGTSVELDVGCSDPDRPGLLIAAICHRCQRWYEDQRRADRPACHAACGDGERRDRRDQPGARRRRDLGAPPLCAARRHSSRGSFRSRAGSGNRSDDGADTAAAPSCLSADRAVRRCGTGSSRIVDSVGRDGQHQVHGAPKAARPDDHPGAGDHRDPHGLPRDPTASSCPRTEDVRAGRRVFRLHRPCRRRAVHLRFHRGRRPRRHRGFRRPDRGDVPAPGGDRPLPLGALSGADPGGAGDHRAAGGAGLRHRVRGVRVRRADTALLQRGERARQPVASRARELGCRPCERGHLQLRLQDRTVVLTRRGAQHRPMRHLGRAVRGSSRGHQDPRANRKPLPPRSGKRRSKSPARTIRTTPDSFCPRRFR